MFLAKEPALYATQDFKNIVILKNIMCLLGGRKVEALTTAEERFKRLTNPLLINLLK